MKYINIKFLLFTALGIFAALTIAHIWFWNLDLSRPANWVGLISKAATIEMILWIPFIKWAWRWKIWQGWLVTIPVIHGTWRGSIHSNWINPQTGEKPAPIPTQLSIYQTLFSLRCTQRTGESISTSFGEEILVDANDPSLIELVYCYRNIPDEKVRERSTVHEGSCILRFSKSNGPKLEGFYWTNRRPTPTTGDIRLDRTGTDPIDALALDIDPHPVSGTNSCQKSD